MFENIEDYIKKSIDSRKKHLNLNENCIEIGGICSTEYRGLLAHFLKTTIPSHKKICLCHACNNAKCSNPKHLYWGTFKENLQDAINNGTHDNINNRSIRKYGEFEFKKMIQEAGRKGGKKGGGTNKLSKDQINERLEIIKNIDLLKYGWVNLVAIKFNCSHTQVKRFVKKYYQGNFYIKNNKRV
jgi:hypothetical protein